MRQRLREPGRTEGWIEGRLVSFCRRGRQRRRDILLDFLQPSGKSGGLPALLVVLPAEEQRLDQVARLRPLDQSCKDPDLCRQSPVDVLLQPALDTVEN